MLSLFQRKRVPLATAAAPPPVEPAKGLTPPQSATSLLAELRRQRLLEHIWQRTSLSRRQFRSLYLAPLERYAELVQQFPASEAHHHAWPGGMLDHGLEIVAYALKLRQSHLLPAGASPEAQAAQAEAWTAGTAYAALLHDIGKIAVDLHVEQADGVVWHPWHGPLRQPYRFRYRTDREYRLHGAATGLLYTRVLDAGILDWLSDYQDLWSALLYVLAGQYEHAGTLGELVVKADQASVALALGGDPARAMAAPKHALQRKLLDGLRYLLREEFKLNQPGGPSDGWLTPEALWLVSKTVSDKLRAHLLSQGIEGIPSNNTAVFTVLQDHGIVQPAPDGKAIWRATVTSGTGWSHSFTFLRLSPALIWESGERPAPFAGTITTEEALLAMRQRRPPPASRPPHRPLEWRIARPGSRTRSPICCRCSMRPTQPPPVHRPPARNHHHHPPPHLCQWLIWRRPVLPPCRLPRGPRRPGKTSSPGSSTASNRASSSSTMRRHWCIPSMARRTWSAPAFSSATCRNIWRSRCWPGKTICTTGNGCRSASRSWGCTVNRTAA